MTEIPTRHTIDALKETIRGRYGEETIRCPNARSETHHLPTGVFTLDMALLGGFVEGFIHQIYGWEASGKTTICMRVVASAQRKYPDRTAIYVDIEGTFDEDWAQAHGVDTEKLMIIQPLTGEDACDIMIAALEADDSSVVILDSLPMLVPSKEVEVSINDKLVATQAVMIGRFVRKVNLAIRANLNRPRPTMIVINQWRSSMAMMGDPRTLPGGNALKFMSSTLVEVKKKKNAKGDVAKDDNDISVMMTGEHSFLIAKMKHGASLQLGEFQITRHPDHPLGAGAIDDAATVVTFAKKYGMVTGGGRMWRLAECSESFPNLKEMALHLYSDLDLFEQTKRSLIKLHREACGRLPEFD